jgi:hypothetical protein
VVATPIAITTRAFFTTVEGTSGWSSPTTYRPRCTSTARSGAPETRSQPFERPVEFEDQKDRAGNGHRADPKDGNQGCVAWSESPKLARHGCGQLPLEFESCVEHRAFHMDIEAEIEATASLIVEVDAAVTQVKVDPGLHGVVNRSRHLPVAMGGDAKAADIAIVGQAELGGKRPAREVDMISPGDQWIDPIGRTRDARSGQDPGVQSQLRRKGPGPEADTQIRVLGRLFENAVKRRDQDAAATSARGRC